MTPNQRRVTGEEVWTAWMEGYLDGGWTVAE
jgi:hypothetical protein